VQPPAINGAFIAGELNRVREDTHEEDQVQADEQEQSEIEHQQLLELAEGYEEMSDLPKCTKEQRHAHEQGHSNWQKPEGETPCVIICSCHKATIYFFRFTISK